MFLRAAVDAEQKRKNAFVNAPASERSLMNKLDEQPEPGAPHVVR